MMKYIKDGWDRPGRPKMALIYNDTGYGRAPVEPAKEYAEVIGIDLVGTEVVGLQDLEATSQLLRIKKKEVDFVFIQETYTATSTILKDAKKLGLKNIIFTGNFWGTGQKLAELAGDAAEGYLGIMPFSIWSDDNEGVQLAHTLNSKYHPNIEYREPQYMAGMVNAMIMVHAVEVALQKAGGDPRKVRGTDVFEALQGIQNFNTRGLTTPVSYSPNERRGANGYKIVTIKDGKLSAVTDFLDAPPVPEQEMQGK